MGAFIRCKASRKIVSRMRLARARNGAVDCCSCGQAVALAYDAGKGAYRFASHKAPR